MAMRTASRRANQSLSAFRLMTAPHVHVIHTRSSFELGRLLDRQVTRLGAIALGCLTLVLTLSTFTPVFAGDVSVRGYYQSDGTYVQPHMRSAPDSSYNNNWPSSPNVNPYTGQQGTVNRGSMMAGTAYMEAATPCLEVARDRSAGTDGSRDHVGRQLESVDALTPPAASRARACGPIGAGRARARRRGFHPVVWNVARQPFSSHIA